MLQTGLKWIIIVNMMLMLHTGSIYANLKAPMEKKERVAIIGGGMSGVAAATFLSDSKYDVYLFESEKELGGHGQTLRMNNEEGGEVDVDLGAQNFIKGPWDIYIEFLKLYGLYHKWETFQFLPSATISKSGYHPHFITPDFSKDKLTFLLFQSKLRSLFSLMHVHCKTHQLYKTKKKDYSVTVGEFLDSLHINQKDKEEVFLPFLASTVGVDVNRITELSATAVAELFAFNPPYKLSKVNVFKEGMGNKIKEIGQKLEQGTGNIHIERSAPVYEVSKVNNQYLVKYMRDGKEEEVVVDNIITAIHPFQVSQIFKNMLDSSGSSSFLSHLSKLEYTTNRVVIHRSDVFNKGDLSSFVNLEFNKEGKTFLTMQLGKINECYGRLSKSWVNDEVVYQQLKKNDDILAEKTYRHPFLTPAFVVHRDGMIQSLEEDDQYKGIAVSGGWTELNETQATAIVSGYKAVKRLFPDLMKEKNWEVYLPSLKKIAC